VLALSRTASGKLERTEPFKVRRIDGRNLSR